MATAMYYQRGESLDYANSTSSKIAANTVIELKDRIGVVGCDINPGETGSLHMTGVFEMDKTGSAKIDMGQKVYFDGTGITDDADDGGSPATAYTPAGYAVAEAAAAATKILVKLQG